MNSLKNSRSVLSRLGRLLLHRYKPAQLTQAPRYTQHVHTAARGLQPSDVLDSIRGLFSRHVWSVATHRTMQAPAVACPPSGLPTHLARRWLRNPRKVAAAVLLPFAAGFAILGAISHRVMFSPSYERKLGDLAFENVKKELVDKILDPSDHRVCRIAANIIRGVHRAFPTRRSDGDSGGSSYNDTSSVTDEMWVNNSQNQGYATVQPQTCHIADLNWEVIVVEDKRVYACSRLGGKIVVHTGCLDHFKTDAEIAVILAHEVGHVVARHFTEFTQIATLIPGHYALLPFSRREEIEADVIGVMLLAASGFDPRVAAGVYEKLADMGGDSAWDDYIGSHPSYRKRSRLLSRGKAIEEALELLGNMARRHAAPVA